MKLPSMDGAAPRRDYPEGWVPGEVPPPPRGPRGDVKWSIVAVAVAAVLTLATVLILARSESSSAATPAGDSPAGAAALDAPASTGDVGPMTVITEDATCGDWKSVQNAVAVARSAGWDRRDPRIPAASMTPDQSILLKTFGDTLRTSADTAVSLAAGTPHRAMRGLYVAFATYGRAYADATPTYQPPDDALAQTALAASEAITRVCGASQSNVAAAQAPRLAAVKVPSTPPASVDLTKPERFLPQSNRVCAKWAEEETALQARLRPWSALDPDLSVAQLDRGQVQIFADTARTVSQFADRMESAGRGSGNPVLEDFATLGALYFRAYGQAVSLISAADHDMAWAAMSLTRLVSAGCRATAA